ncbi:MAG: hypothetical protein Q4B67_09145 [Eubacteriales bacterium]|nr:hypothetical protein [Eubacteriales bacterium]
MDGIIHVRNLSYNRYEELITRRDALKKAAYQFERAYNREFGELILEIFSLKLECIRKKKTIGFCQAAANMGRAVDRNELMAFLNREMEAMQTQLDCMIEDLEDARRGKVASPKLLMDVRKIYHRLVRRIHPDVNPLMEKSEELRELWQMAVAAYNCNDLNSLQEVEVLIEKVMEQLGGGNMVIDIPNIEEKIAALEDEIKRIRETEPYTYGELLDDVTATEAKRAELLKEKLSYEEYSTQLDEILNGLLGEGVSLVWRMN